MSEPAERRLFGTDGVRGVAGAFLSAELALGLGRAATAGLGRTDSRSPRVLVIRDTRESGPMLEAAVAAGIAAAGGEALLGGVLPTPAAPLLLRAHGFDLGVVLSASHNPYADNGVKFFAGDGFKLSDAAEAAIEQRLADPAPSAAIGSVERLSGIEAEYVEALVTRFRGLDLSGRRIVLDCANGATHRAAPAVFRRLGADVEVLAADPDGRNINAGCGSTHLDLLQAAITRGGHELGFAFDGDGDRMLAVDRHGTVVDGDELIALAARHRHAAGRLPGDGVAVTVMTNYGFHTAMREAGIAVTTTAVGDRYVLEALRERGWALGGEQSGHIIDMELVPSGDGIGAALLALEALGEADLAERHAMEKLPQVLVNVTIADRGSFAGAARVHRAVAEADAALAGRGRVLVRPSGTEPLVRVMAEAPTREEAERVCAELAALVAADLG